MFPHRPRYRAECYRAAISLQRVPSKVSTAHTTHLKESAMTHMSHIRRITLVAVIGLAVLVG